MKKHKLYAYTYISIIIFTLVLTGCGSGGGGNQSGTGGEITYTGATTQAKITADNANSIFSVIWSGGTSPATAGKAQVKGLRAPIAISTGRIIPYLFGISDDVKHYIGREKAKSGAAPKEINETKDGSVSGTLTTAGNIDENTGTGTLTLTYQNYNDGDGTYDGVLTARVDAYDVSYKIITDMTMSFTMWTIKDKGRSISTSGSIRVQESLINNSETQTINVVIRDNNTNETSKQENLVVTNIYNNIFTPSNKTETASGRVYIEKYGYVDVSTVSPFIYSAYPQGTPDKGGPILLSGAGNSKAGITSVSTSKVRIEVDTDGDCTFESKNVYSWNDIAGTPLPNSTPTANAGPDKTVITGSTVTLDGSGSSDADGDSMTYTWAFTAKPSGSSAAISDPTAVKPTFTPDVDGAYTLSLVVNDGKASSAADSVTITASNKAPTANAGPDQTVITGSTVTLDGSGSSDADGDPLTYAWTFTSKPSGSAAVLSSAGAVKPTFITDTDGAYVLNLVVNDGKVSSAADSVSITSYTPDTTAPTVPSGLTATAFSDTRINLTWTASTDNVGVTGYKIYRDGVLVGTATSTSHSDTGLSGATSYSYTVSAYDTVENESAKSATANAKTKGTAIGGGQISSDTTWSVSGSPYWINGNVLVNSGTTLTIEPGTTIKFGSGNALQIDGTLIAKGTDTNRITFTSNKSTPAAGDWGYVRFSDSSTDATYDGQGNYTGGSILEYVIVEYAGGISIDDNGAIIMNNAHPFINYCIIMNNKASGLYGYNLTGTLKISNSTINDNKSEYSIKSGGIYASGNSLTTTILISNNMISNNSGSFGGGIATWYVWSGTTTISGNTISGNTASVYGGGISIVNGYADISNNTIRHNTAGYDGGGIWGGKTITKNIISNNKAGWGGGGLSTYGADIRDNIISLNTATSGNGGGVNENSGGSIVNNLITNNTVLANDYYSRNGGGISASSAATISNNAIINNTAPSSAGIYQGSVSISGNTIISNITTGTAPTYTVDLAGNTSTCKSNNIFGNTATYELYNATPQGLPNIDATNNWWGTSVESQIQAKIYDWFDDATKGIVTYSPFATAIRTDAPISPPTGLTATAGTGQITLSWSANPESDTAGYRVYWGTTSGSPYQNSIDAGNVTTYTINSLPVGTYYVAVTAYDADAAGAMDDPATIVNEKQTGGKESWFADEKTVSVTSSSFAQKTNAGSTDAAAPLSEDSSSQSKTGCFIATAAYGSYLDPHVMILREFRDKYLLTNSAGRAYVSFYYKLSPPVADCIRGHETLRAVTRWALTPVVYGIGYPWGLWVILTPAFIFVLRRKK